MKKIIQYLLFTFLLISSYLPLWGQGGFYPVQVTSYWQPPNLARLSDYATSGEMKYTLVLNNTDITDGSRQVKLKLTIENINGGIITQNNNFVINATPVFLPGGSTQRLTNINLRPYFDLQNLQGITPQQYSAPLPDGMYNFCWEVFDFFTGKRLSNKSCNMVYLSLNDPPVLNIPTKNELIIAKNPTNIVFTWTPRQINALNVQYEFELKEILNPNFDIQSAFFTNRSLWKENTYATMFLYDMGKPALIPGQTYAWRVRAISGNGFGGGSPFKNDGYSEIFWFKYANDCTPPTHPLAEALSPTHVKLSWQSSPLQNRFKVQYRRKYNKKGKKITGEWSWFNEQSISPRMQIMNLEAGVTYEYRVGASCDNRTVLEPAFTYGDIGEFTMPDKKSTDTGYNCGVMPPIDISNKEPLVLTTDPSNGGVGSEFMFTASDFEVNVLEYKTMAPGIYSGIGYISVPYLADTKIKVVFDHIKINTDYKMIEGVVKTTFDPTMGNIVDVKKGIEDIKKQADNVLEAMFGPQNGEENIVLQSDSLQTNEEVASDGDMMIVGNEGNENNPINENVSAVSSNDNQENLTPTNPNASSSNPTNTNNPTTPPDNPLYISYNGKKYYDGQTINLKFKRNLIADFEFKDLEENQLANWDKWVTSSAHYQILGEKQHAIKMDLSKRESKESVRNDEFLEPYFADDEKKRVKVNIKFDYTNFNITSLIAKSINNPNRIAKTGETLYYVNKPTISTEKKNTEFKANVSIPLNEIAEDNIEWKFNNEISTSSYGKDIITQKVNEDKNITATCIAGYPNASSKTVNVKWVDEGRNEASFMPPAVSYAIQELNSKILIPLKVVTDKLNNWLGTDKFKAEIKPIKIKGEKYNEEDKNSRHYLEILKGSVGGGLIVKGEFLGYPPFLKILNIDGISKVGIYVTPKVEFNLLGGAMNKKTGETQKVLKDELFIEANVKGCIELGLKAELLVANDLIDFSVSGYGEACASGKANYNITTNDFKGGFYLDPIKLGVKAKIKTNGTLPFTIVDIDESWSVTTKVILYENK